MPTEYQVNVEMDAHTVDTLHNSNFRLYGFKAVRAVTTVGMPLVWFNTDRYSTKTDVTWETQYQAYTSRDQIIPNGRISASFNTNIDLGETLEVTGTGGTGDVTGDGVSGAVSILNKTTTPFTCGISEVQNGKANPMCAFPLFGLNLDVIAPIEKVLLMFSTRPVNTGTVIEQAYGPGIFVDLTGAQDNRRTVQYDINKGWSWDGGTWARQIPPNANLVPLLIENNAFAARALAA